MPRRVMEGRVVGDKTNKTVTVLVERRIMDPLYKKFIRRSKKYSAHDEANAFRIGDAVSIQECPPVSKSKRWVVISQAPAKARDEKPVVAALAARAEAEKNKPEPKKKAAAAVKTVKPAKVEAPAAEQKKLAKVSKPQAKAAIEDKAAAAPKPRKKKDDQ